MAARIGCGSHEPLTVRMSSEDSSNKRQKDQDQCDALEDFWPDCRSKSLVRRNKSVTLETWPRSHGWIMVI